MYEGNGIPKLQSNKHFPIGDITDAHKTKRVNEWMDRITKMENGQFGTYIHVHQKPSNLIENTGPAKNYHGGVELCRKWDSEHTTNRKFAVTGYILAMAFNNDTHYLPVPTTDLSGDLKLMQEHTRAQSFGRTAWRSMQQYPNVAATYEQLFDHARSRWDIGSEENSEYFMAGFMLPFMMSQTGRLINYTPEFNGMTSERHNLRTTDFHRFFTRDVDLAPDVILPNIATEES